MSFSAQASIPEAREALRAQGFYQFPTSHEADVCQTITGFMDGHQADARTHFYYGQTEMRIWEAHERHPALGQFFEECHAFLERLEGQADPVTLLAIRNRPLLAGDQTSAQGRWHLDSLRRQLKIFLFLNGATEQSGPLELLPGTQRPSFKYGHLVTGAFGMPWDFAPGRTRRYARLNDTWVERLTTGQHPTMPVVCAPGTAILVDTSAIHRARPCVEGSRYALTAYYR